MMTICHSSGWQRHISLASRALESNHRHKADARSRREAETSCLRVVGSCWESQVFLDLKPRLILAPEKRHYAFPVNKVKEA